MATDHVLDFDPGFDPDDIPSGVVKMTDGKAPMTFDDINAATGFANGELFCGPGEVRSYFTVATQRDIFGATEGIQTQEELDRMAAIVIENGWHMTAQNIAPSFDPGDPDVGRAPCLCLHLNGYTAKEAKAIIAAIGHACLVARTSMDNDVLGSVEETGDAILVVIGAKD